MRKKRQITWTPRGAVATKMTGVQRKMLPVPTKTICVQTARVSVATETICVQTARIFFHAEMGFVATPALGVLAGECFAGIKSGHVQTAWPACRVAGFVRECSGVRCEVTLEIKSKVFAEFSSRMGASSLAQSATNIGMKDSKKRIHVTLQISARTYAEFEAANREIIRRTGAAPGVEALMAFFLRARNDACDMADIYCYKALRQSPELIAQYRRK